MKQVGEETQELDDDFLLALSMVCLPQEVGVGNRPFGDISNQGRQYQGYDSVSHITSFLNGPIVCRIPGDEENKGYSQRR